MFWDDVNNLEGSSNCLAHLLGVSAERHVVVDSYYFMGYSGLAEDRLKKPIQWGEDGLFDFTIGVGRRPDWLFSW
jgi:hypothetical protein